MIGRASPQCRVICKPRSIIIRLRRSFFETLERANRDAILWQIQTVKKAKPRTRRVQQFIARLERKEKIYQ